MSSSKITCRVSLGRRIWAGESTATRSASLATLAGGMGCLKNCRYERSVSSVKSSSCSMMPRCLQMSAYERREEVCNTRTRACIGPVVDELSAQWTGVRELIDAYKEKHNA